MAEVHVFRDDGYSGSRLDRPGLDGLRDAIHDAAIDVVAVFSPDRLARKYAYQVLLLEEFRRAGCEVVFLHHPISDDPNDQLLLQIQGAIAEYGAGRAFPAWQASKGTRWSYSGQQSPLRISLRAEARHRSGPTGHRRSRHGPPDVHLGGSGRNDRPTVCQALERRSVDYPIRKVALVVLGGLPHPVRPGVHRHGLRQPLRVRCPEEAARPHRNGERTCRHPRPAEQWIAIAVPALIDQATWDGVQARLARNAAMSYRRNKKHDYLLRCLLKCGTCGLGIHGCYFPGQGGRPGRRYYRCAGTDPLTTGRDTKCPRARIEADALETVVWDHVCSAIPPNS